MSTDPIQVPVPNLVEEWPCFTIYDKKAARFGVPSAAPNEDVALRQFGDLCSAPGSVYYLHSSDFDLFYCGDWNPQNGEFHPAPQRHITNGTAVKETS